VSQGELAPTADAEASGMNSQAAGGKAGDRHGSRYQVRAEAATGAQQAGRDHGDRQASRYEGDEGQRRGEGAKEILGSQDGREKGWLRVKMFESNDVRGVGGWD